MNGLAAQAIKETNHDLIPQLGDGDSLGGFPDAGVM